jgi:hypothetical protein
MKLGLAGMAVVLGLAAVSSSARAEEPGTEEEKKAATEKKEAVVKAKAADLDAKLGELFNVPETPAANALGITGEAITHPDTVKDVALQVFGALSDDADLSQGVALEFAPFRRSIYDEIELDDFEKLDYGSELLANVSLSFAALSEADADAPSVQYGIGGRISLLDDTDFRRNSQYRTKLYSLLDECQKKLDIEPPAPKIVYLTEAEALETIQKISEAIDAWAAKRANEKQQLDEAKAQLAAALKRIPQQIEAGDAAASDALAKEIALRKLDVEAKQAALDADPEKAKILSRFGELATRMGPNTTTKRSKAQLARFKAEKKFQEHGGYPPKSDEVVAQGGEDRQKLIADKAALVCKDEIEGLDSLTSELQGHRFELSTVTILRDVEDDDVEWDRSNTAAAWEYRGTIGHFGTAGRGTFYRDDDLVVQLDGGLRGGFKAGILSGAVSAAVGAKDLEDAELVVLAGANGGVVVAETFMARVGLLATYQETPGPALTAYFALATANGEDFFTKALDL